MFQPVTHSPRRPWNKGKLIGQKPPLKLHEIWAIRIRLRLARRARDLALFNLAIASKLRGCGLVRLKIMAVAHGGEVFSQAMVMQRKTGKPVRFEITEQTRKALADRIAKRRLAPYDHLFPSCIRPGGYLSTRQYLRLVKSWIARIGLEPNANGTHSLRRTKAALIYRRTENLRAVQRLPGHRKLESTVRYLGIEV